MPATSCLPVQPSLLAVHVPCRRSQHTTATVHPLSHRKGTKGAADAVLAGVQLGPAQPCLRACLRLPCVAPCPLHCVNTLKRMLVMQNREGIAQAAAVRAQHCVPTG